MLEVKSQEVKRHCLRHPSILKMPTNVSYVSWVDGILFYSFIVSYLTSIFEMLTRNVGLPMGTSIAARPSTPSFIDHQTAMPVLQAGA